MQEMVRSNKIQGFGLVELMIAQVILAFGLLAAAPLLYVTASSGSLARSKSTAAITAQDKIESLADLYYRNPLAEDLTLGNHGPQYTQVVNPADGTVLNRYDIGWVVSTIPDPRPGKAVAGRLIRVTITPAKLTGEKNSHPAFNKILNVTTILGRRMR